MNLAIAESPTEWKWGRTAMNQTSVSVAGGQIVGPLDVYGFFSGYENSTTTSAPPRNKKNPTASAGMPKNSRPATGPGPPPATASAPRNVAQVALSKIKSPIVRTATPNISAGFILLSL